MLMHGHFEQAVRLRHLDGAVWKGVLDRFVQIDRISYFENCLKRRRDIGAVGSKNGRAGSDLRAPGSSG